MRLFSKRPKIVELKNRFGDLDVDIIIRKNHNQAIETINDRASVVLKKKRVVSNGPTHPYSIPITSNKSTTIIYFSSKTNHTTNTL